MVILVFGSANNLLSKMEENGNGVVFSFPHETVVYNLSLINLTPHCSKKVFFSGQDYRGLLWVIRFVNLGFEIIKKCRGG